MSEYIDPIVYWPASSTLELEEFELEVPYKTTGRIEIYKVPPCEAYPEGYFVALNTNTSWYSSVEPGCAAWEKTLLARLLINDPSKADEDEGHSGSRENIVEYLHPELSAGFDYTRFNPNSTKTTDTAAGTDTATDTGMGE